MKSKSPKKKPSPLGIPVKKGIEFCAWTWYKYAKSDFVWMFEKDDKAGLALEYNPKYKTATVYYSWRNLDQPYLSRTTKKAPYAAYKWFKAISIREAIKKKSEPSSLSDYQKENLEAYDWCNGRKLGLASDANYMFSKPGMDGYVLVYNPKTKSKEYSSPVASMYKSLDDAKRHHILYQTGASSEAGAESWFRSNVRFMAKLEYDGSKPEPESDPRPLFLRGRQISQFLSEKGNSVQNSNLQAEVAALKSQNEKYRKNIKSLMDFIHNLMQGD